MSRAPQKELAIAFVAFQVGRERVIDQASESYGNEQQTSVPKFVVIRIRRAAIRHRPRPHQYAVHLQTISPLQRHPGEATTARAAIVESWT